MKRNIWFYATITLGILMLGGIFFENNEAYFADKYRGLHFYLYGDEERHVLPLSDRFWLSIYNKFKKPEHVAPPPTIVEQETNAQATGSVLRFDGLYKLDDGDYIQFCTDGTYQLVDPTHQFEKYAPGLYKMSGTGVTYTFSGGAEQPSDIPDIIQHKDGSLYSLMMGADGYVDKLTFDTEDHVAGCSNPDVFKEYALSVDPSKTYSTPSDVQSVTKNIITAGLSINVPETSLVLDNAILFADPQNHWSMYSVSFSDVTGKLAKAIQRFCYITQDPPLNIKMAFSGTLVTPGSCYDLPYPTGDTELYYIVNSNSKQYLLYPYMLDSNTGRKALHAALRSLQIASQSGSVSSGNVCISLNKKQYCSAEDLASLNTFQIDGHTFTVKVINAAEAGTAEKTCSSTNCSADPQYAYSTLKAAFAEEESLSIQTSGGHGNYMFLQSSNGKFLSRIRVESNSLVQEDWVTFVNDNMVIITASVTDPYDAIDANRLLLQ